VPPCSPAILSTILACSATLASVPWKSIHKVGATGKSIFEYRLTASIVAASASSIRATGTPNWMVWITVFTAASTLGNEQVAADIATGMP
jgi:hypothetical protein